MGTDGKSSTTIAANLDNVRGVAGQLHNSLELLEGVRKQIADIKHAAVVEASVGTKSNSPAPIMSPLLNSMNAALAKIDDAISTFKKNVGADAEALTKLADGLEETTNRGARNITQAAHG
jgi:hypothetical protein